MWSAVHLMWKCSKTYSLNDYSVKFNSFFHYICCQSICCQSICYIQSVLTSYSILQSVFNLWLIYSRFQVSHQLYGSVGCALQPSSPSRFRTIWDEFKVFYGDKQFVLIWDKTLFSLLSRLSFRLLICFTLLFLNLNSDFV